MTSALLLSTYNWPQALELVFQSILQQVQLPDEVIVADDGSKAETRAMVGWFESICPVPVTHIWHEDLGFRKAAILNKAVAQTDKEYIVQIDGDCILHPAFVKDHLKAAAKGVFLYGSRVNIKEAYLPEMFQKKQFLFSLFSPGIRNRTRNLHIPFLGTFYKPHSEFSRKYRGCNTSYFREDFIRVNGYNEAFEGWGREDSDLAHRFLNAGLQMKRLRYRGIVYHIHHPIKSKVQLAANDALEQRTIKEKHIRCERGIDQYL